ncbi:DUF2971 domain-containing protein [Stenotrophomonas sp. NPDC078853]|uniref:DUF2971 domain-containing protein n=1 Tax=Stenotrophomonas sp. NPDC078853 TaxID=3364534 RepID=UPI00384D1B0A
MGSTKSEIESLEEELWKLDENKTFPNKAPLLAHYTSLATLEQIAGAKELWLSHPYLMNDHQELAWALEEGVRRALGDAQLTAALGVSAGEFGEILSNLSGADINSYNLDIYLACFSEHVLDRDGDGVLSMWRAYGGGGSGAALIFDSSKLIADEASPFILAPVAYYSTEERLAFIDWAVFMMSVTVKNIAPLDRHTLQELAWIYYHRLRVFALFTKHVGFAEENEWRLVYDPKRDDWDEYVDCRSYVITSRGIEPKLKLPLNSDRSSSKVKFDEILSAVLLGPAASSALSLHATRRMLKELGCAVLSESVSASGTPLRLG